jgi:hypothetical protein
LRRESSVRVASRGDQNLPQSEWRVQRRRTQANRGVLLQDGLCARLERELRETRELRMHAARQQHHTAGWPDFQKPRLQSHLQMRRSAAHALGHQTQLLCRLCLRRQRQQRARLRVQTGLPRKRNRVPKRFVK